jgi:hypothetical protein
MAASGTSCSLSHATSVRRESLNVSNIRVSRDRVPSPCLHRRDEPVEGDGRTLAVTELLAPEIELGNSLVQPEGPIQFADISAASTARTSACRRTGNRLGERTTDHADTPVDVRAHPGRPHLRAHDVGNAASDEPRIEAI